MRARLVTLEAETARPDLWEDRARAGALLREKSALERELESAVQLEERVSDAEVLLELAAEADDAPTLLEAAEKMNAAAAALDEAEVQRLLGGEFDAGNAILTINAGAGGTDAADWAEMLFRMYTRWADARGYRVQILDAQEGEEAGLRSVTALVNGALAFGYLRAEQGVHRLVRISPFDSAGRRHTAFASVAVTPELDDTIEVEIDENDLRIDTYRAGGAGGQHVNKTDSAVRIRHEPTGLVVQCQNERSQHKNKAQALKVLRARLYEHRQREQEAARAALAGERKAIDFGSQIRSYTLHPAQRVKDHRTGLDAGNAQGVLDGDIDAFIRAALLAKLDEASASATPTVTL